jgi:hypothetical protein
MARLSRKTHRKNKTHRRRHSRRGGAMIQGSPLSYSLADDWSSKMANGQGGDFLKYHVGQHGGSHMSGAPLSAIDGSQLPAALRGPAHIGGLDRAFTDVAGLKDQAGGRRKHRKNRKHRTRRGKSTKKHGGRRKTSKKSRRRRSRRSLKRGGALGYAPFGSSSMLLDSAGYQKAGLTPEWAVNSEFDAAKMRASM